METEVSSQAWLVRHDGASAGTRFLLQSGVTRVGRDPGSDIVVGGENAEVVSSRHLEIRREGSVHRLRDLDSTNGTFVDGERVSEKVLEQHAVIRLGSGGPKLRFELGAKPEAPLEKTIVLPPIAGRKRSEEEPQRSVKPRPQGKRHEELLTEAVLEARKMRDAGHTGHTHIIMRKMLGSAIHHSGKKWKTLVALLATALVAITAFGYWKIQDLQEQKDDIDRQIQKIEEQLQEGGLDAEELEQLAARLETYQKRAENLQDSLLYQLGVEGREQAFIQAEIKKLMTDFGAETYSIPPEFVEQVERFVRQYQERDRRHVERLLGRSMKDLEVIREVLEQQNLPPDLAYMVLVESAFLEGSTSPAGAVGPWQFTASTARAYGMRIDGEVDERLDLTKSTKAASRYIRDLILEFGAGSSVMLALAAYNFGPSRVRRAIRKVDDPIKQRSFWYLYRVRALPIETRQYVPKIVAAILIGRNPEQFGFNPES